MSGALAALIGAADPLVDISATSFLSSSDGNAPYAGGLGTDGASASNQFGQVVAQWLRFPRENAGNAFECRLDVIGGSFSGSATGTWLALSSTRNWNCSSGSGTISIRKKGSSVTIDSAVCTWG